MEFDLSKSLAIKNPELIAEWHPLMNGSLTPWDVSYGTQKKAWWVCRTNQSHVWSAQIQARHRGSKCPYCSGKKASIDYCLAAENPELAKEWHPVLNGSLKPEDVSPNSLVEVYWLCEKCGFEWKAAIGHRSSNNTGCPNCNGRKVLSPENCLATIHPELIDQWDWERNEGLTPYDVFPGNLRRVYWKCSKGHKYQMRISDKSNGMGCTVCSRGQSTKFPKQTLFYYLKEVFKDAK